MALPLLVGLCHVSLTAPLAGVAAGSLDAMGVPTVIGSVARDGSPMPLALIAAMVNV